MIEPEIAFADLNDDADLAEEFLKVLFEDLLVRRGDDMKLFDLRIDKGVIEPDVTSLRMLADAWMLAKEYDKAEDALNRAAQRADDGELYLRLAQIHAEQAEWTEALAAARRAVERGNLKRPDQARMTEGLALYNMDRLEEAKAAFSRASRYEQSEAAARQWTSYISREQERLAALDRAREAAERAASQSSG